MRKNLLLIVVDAMRFDVLEDADSAKFLMPNMAKLAESGYLLPCVANAQATQFVMPSLFTSTYPLDFGGYNNGILDRPASFVEHLKDAGFQTCLASSCNILSSVSGYQRGFDQIHAAIDYRHILDYRIEKTHSYHLRRLSDGEIDEAEAAKTILPVFDRELAALKQEIDNGGKSTWGRDLRRYNEWIAAAVPAERRLIGTSPNAVLQKLLTLPPVLYWRWLGKEKVGKFDLVRRRVGEASRWRWKRFAVKHEIPFFWVSHQQVLAEEVVDGLINVIPNLKSPWYAHLHVMDIHDFQSQSRPGNVLRKLRYVPRFLKARRAGSVKRQLFYDLALAYFDEEFGKLLAALDRSDQREATMIAIIADHGSFYAASPRHKRNVALRTNFEDIDIPFLLNGTVSAGNEDVLLDTMGVSSTLLEICGIKPPADFKGIPLSRGGCDTVISETAGGGNADLLRRDLYFTVTTLQHRMMAVLHDQELQVFALFNRKEDPHEKQNLAEDPESKELIAKQLKSLLKERREIFALRGLDGDSLIENWRVISPETVEERI